MDLPVLPIAAMIPTTPDLGERPGLPEANQRDRLRGPLPNRIVPKATPTTHAWTPRQERPVTPRLVFACGGPR